MDKGNTNQNINKANAEGITHKTSVQHKNTATHLTQRRTILNIENATANITLTLDSNNKQIKHKTNANNTNMQPIEKHIRKTIINHYINRTQTNRN